VPRVFPPPRPGSAVDTKPPNQCPMPRLPAKIQITVPLPAADYRIYISAARKLRRLMGRQAPDALNLVRFSLQGRDASGVADDYLDAIRWPPAAGRMVSLRRPVRSARRTARIVARASRPAAEARLPAGCIRAPADPSRN
jgi:hypothetical protein